MEDKPVLTQLSMDEIRKVFGPKGRACGLAELVVAEFVKSGEPAMEVDWKQVAGSFRIAKQRLSGAISQVRFSPYNYGIMTKKEYSEAFRKASGSDLSFNPVYDVGIRSLSKEERVFLVHKESKIIVNLRKEKPCE